MITSDVMSSTETGKKILVLSFALAITFSGTHLFFQPIDRTAAHVQDVPYRLLDWKGEDRDIPNPVLKTLGVDDFLMREYINGDSRFWLYIGYYRSQRGGKTIHSPKHCYPSAGWQTIDSSVLPFRVTDNDRSEKSISVNRYLLEKNGEQELVYYWYQAGGNVEASEISAVAYRFWNALYNARTDGALVRISTRVNRRDIGESEKIAKAIPLIYLGLRDVITR